MVTIWLIGGRVGEAATEAPHLSYKSSRGLSIPARRSPATACACAASKHSFTPCAGVETASSHVTGGSFHKTRAFKTRWSSS